MAFRKAYGVERGNGEDQRPIAHRFKLKAYAVCVGLHRLVDKRSMPLGFELASGSVNDRVAWFLKGNLLWCLAENLKNAIRLGSSGSH